MAQTKAYPRVRRHRQKRLGSHTQFPKPSSNSGQACLIGDGWESPICDPGNRPRPPPTILFLLIQTAGEWLHATGGNPTWSWNVYYSWGFAAKILQLNAYADSTWALSSEGKKASAASYLCARQPTASSMAHSGSNSAYLLFLLPDVVIPMHLFHRAVGTKSEESLTYSNCSVNDGHIVYSLINSYFCKVGVMNGWRVWVWWRYIQGINVYLLKYFPYTQAPLGFVSGYVWV